MKKHHEVSGLHFRGVFMFLTIDGQEKKFKVSEVSSVLHNATGQQKMAFEISPSGYGIHWPLLDEDLSMDGLLRIVHSPKSTVKRA